MLDFFEADMSIEPGAASKRVPVSAERPKKRG
jgi:hypothetical protein